MVRGSVDMNVPGYTHDPYSEMLLAAPPNASGASNFYATNQFPFASTWNGWSPAQTFAAVASGGPYAIVDGHYAPATISFGGGSSAPHPTVSVGEVVRLASPDGGRSVNVTVVGILKETMLGAVWVGPGTASALGDRNATAYFLTVRPGVSTTLAAQLAKVAFFRWDLVLFDIHALLASSTSTTEGFIGLLEIFVGLGLGVGVAAMGILALRAVAERRRDLGILRAEGCTRRQVVETLVVEYSFVTLLGVGMGTALALILVYDATISSSAAANGIPTFWAPWTTVVAIAAVAYALVLAAIAAPALRAARLAPATALRASE
jgi:putative ABC transport system permease protein